MSVNGNCVLLYKSIHDVMSAEKAIKARGIWCDLIPTPRQLSSDCGMSLEVRGKDLPAVVELTAAAHAAKQVYRVVSGSFKPVE